MELLKGKPVADLICEKVQTEAEELLEKGIVLKDTREGTIFEVIK